MRISMVQNVLKLVVCTNVSETGHLHIFCKLQNTALVMISWLAMNKFPLWSDSWVRGGGVNIPNLDCLG